MSSRHRAPPAEQKEPPPGWVKTVSFVLLVVLLGVVWYIGPQALLEKESEQDMWLLAQTNCFSLEGQVQVGENYSLDLARAQDFCQMTLALLEPDPESDTPLARLKYLGELIWGVTFRPLWESLFVGGADGYWEQWRQDYVDRLALQRESRELAGSSALPSVVDHSGEVREDGVNPSYEAVVQEAMALEAEYGIPMEYVLSACRYDSGGLRQWELDGSIVQGHNPSSTDWGMCQVNDYWNADLVSQFDLTNPESPWQDNLRAGFIVMNRQCWSQFSDLADGPVMARNLFGCYNGSGPDGLYADRAMAVYETAFWEPIVADLEDEAREQEELVADETRRTEEAVSGDTSSPQGISPVEGPWVQTQGDHNGTGAVDIGIAGNPCPDTDPHYNISTINGTVSVVGGYNNIVMVENARYRVEYWHNYEILVDDNTSANQGDRIAIMGQTGNTTWTAGCNGVHLHYVIYDKLLGQYVSAQTWIVP